MTTKMNRTFVFIFLLSKVQFISAVVKHIDPRKTYFTFDEDEVETKLEEDNIHEFSSDSVNLEKYRDCLTENNNICKHFVAFLKEIVKHADEDAIVEKLSFEVILTQTEIRRIKAILRTSKCPEEAFLVLKSFLPSVKWKSWLLEELKKLVIDNKNLIAGITITLLLFLLLMYWVTMSKSWRAGILKMFCLVFLASVVTTWYRNYQKVLSKKRVILKDGIPLACRPNDQTYFESFWLFIKSRISVMPDDCLTYYEADTVDPALDTTIIDAISETTSRFILTPVPIIFEYLGKALVKLFQMLPSYLWLPVILVVTALIIINMFLSHKYRIRTIFGSLEPAPVNQTAILGTSAENVQRIMNSSPSTVMLSPGVDIPVQERLAISSNLSDCNSTNLHSSEKNVKENEEGCLEVSKAELCSNSGRCRNDTGDNCSQGGDTNSSKNYTHSQGDSNMPFCDEKSGDSAEHMCMKKKRDLEENVLGSCVEDIRVGTLKLDKPLVEEN